MALAGGELPETVCSHLGGAGGGAWQLLQFLDFLDLVRLRSVCSELRSMTSDYLAWRRRLEPGWQLPQAPLPKGVVQGSLEQWRAAAGPPLGRR